MNNERLKTLLEFIEKKRKDTDLIVIAIDGDAGAGKSTLSYDLAKSLNAHIVHMDDFYLPFEKRKECATCHMDFERVLNSVLIPNKKNETLSYYTYNAHQDEIVERVNVSHVNVLILEGSYSYHPSLRAYIDISVALKVDEQTQKERIIQRSNEERYEFFKNVWIQKEKTYQKETDLLNSVDFIL